MVLAAMLQNVIGLSPPPGASDASRVAWVWTSRLRQNLAGAESLKASSATELAAAAGLQAQLKAQISAAPPVTADQIERTRQRLASINASNYSTILAAGANESTANAAIGELVALWPGAKQRELMTEIVMVMNPKSVSFKQPKRITSKTTREGRVFFHFTNSKGQNNDLLTISCRGNTGNIDRRASQGEAPGESVARMKTDQAAVRRIMTWHNLLLLSMEPVRLPDGSLNLVTLTLTSPLFPAGIQLSGHFNAVIEFTEEGAKPNSRDYSFDFTVHETFPPYDELLDWIAAVLENAVFANASTEIAAPEVLR